MGFSTKDQTTTKMDMDVRNADVLITHLNSNC